MTTDRFSGLTLNYRKSAKIQEIPLVSAVCEDHHTSKESQCDIGRSSLHLGHHFTRNEKGDKTEYFLEVTDNAGKSTRSETRSLFYKSPEEAFKKNKEEAREIEE
ncbi:MAG: hypothetical protein IPG99_05945 [Ignavibacteria bacterium]|nr:hypothetical protein [Ignavibacteria bacterium]